MEQISDMHLLLEIPCPKYQKKKKLPMKISFLSKKLLEREKEEINCLVIAAAGPNNQSFINLTNRDLLIDSRELLGFV